MIATEVNRLRETIDIFPDPVVVVDSSGHIVECNEQMRPVFGYEPEELKGQELEILIPERLRSSHLKNVQRYFRDPANRKMARNTHLWGLCKSGHEIAVDIALSPYEFEGELMVIAAIRDVSSMRKIEKRLLGKNNHLETINAELEKFACTVSHDLKSPLNSLQDLINLLVLEVSGEKSAEVSELVGEVKARIEGMQKLINGILEYSRQGLGKEKIEAVNLHDLSQEVQRLIDKPESFRIIATAPLPTVMGNRTKLFQVLLNLYTNAIKYNDKEYGILEISHESRPTELVFHFADNGQRVSEGIQNSMFDLFVSSDPLAENGRSHGIGLSTARKIIEEHGGRIWYSESSMGGTCISFTLKKTAKPQEDHA